jgi:hypothetical protein
MHEDDHVTDPKIQLHCHLGVAGPGLHLRAGAVAGLAGALCDAGTRAALRQRGEQAGWRAT